MLHRPSLATAAHCLARSIESLGDPLRLASGGVLALIGVWGLYRGRREPPPSDVDLPGPADCAATYAKFLGLTLINPLTVVYFAALILGSGLAKDLTATGAAFFIAGAFLASLSWQIGLAGVGAFARHRLPHKFRIGAVVAGNLLIITMAAIIIAR